MCNRKIEKMKIGFTGTKKGMSTEQIVAFHELIDQLDHDEGISEFHHGDCVGADADAHEIMYIGCDVIIHPPTNSSKRAYCKGYKELREEKEYLDRNKDIVDETNLLIAIPCGYLEQIRSGTWSTIRYARKQGKTIIILFPDGTSKTE